MADYNVNMKQWNGTSFDNVLPLAYNAKQLEGQSLAEVKQWVQDNGLLLYTGQYTGTGTYGMSNPTSITFPFEPILLLGGAFANISYDSESNLSILDGNLAILTSISNTRYNEVSSELYAKMSADRKTISWYYDGRTNPASSQNNQSGVLYFYAAIGGHDMGGKIPVGTPFIITSSGSWEVPATGRYMLELYGMGGDGFGTQSLGASGGSSCQHYDSITLTKGDIQQIVIGDYSNSATKFGSYSVNNGGNAWAGTGGLGSGNYGKDGIDGMDVPSTPSNGALSGRYGDGGNWSLNSAAPGAVYLKYLGD